MKYLPMDVTVPGTYKLTDLAFVHRAFCVRTTCVHRAYNVRLWYNVHRFAAIYIVHRVWCIVHRASFTVFQTFAFIVHRLTCMVQRLPCNVHRVPFIVHRSSCIVHRSSCNVHRASFIV